MGELVSTFIREYEHLYKSKEIDFNDIMCSGISFPRFCHNHLCALCDLATEHFANQPTLLRIEGDFTIVGDIHGNIRDLMRIISHAGDPLNTNYLFLGDYVDRGDFSLEVISLLLALVLANPDRVYLLRGNHEFAEVNSQYGFKDQVRREYDENIWKKFNEVFEQLPLAAVISSEIFCVHGGLSPLFSSIEQLENISKPIIDEKSHPDTWKMIMDLMWSDPCTSVPMFIPSMRGHGCLFGGNAILNFLNENKMKRILRAHQFSILGVSGVFGDSVITIFSSSNYRPDAKNSCGLIKYSYGNNINAFNLEPLDQLKKEQVLYYDVYCDGNHIALSMSGLKSIKVFSPTLSVAHVKRINTSSNNLLAIPQRSPSASSNISLTVKPRTIARRNSLMNYRRQSLPSLNSSKGEDSKIIPDNSLYSIVE